MWIPLRTNSQVFWALAVASQPSVGNYSALTRRNVRAILRRPKNPKIGSTPLILNRFFTDYFFTRFRYLSKSIASENRFLAVGSRSATSGKVPSCLL